MRQTNPLVGLGLVLLGIAVAVVVVLASGVLDRSKDDGHVAVNPILAAATLSPRGSHFADSVDARVDVAVDTQRVDPASVVVDARFGPYTEVEPPHVERERVGRIERMFWGVTLRCLEDSCRPLRQVERVRFAPLRVRYRLDSNDVRVAKSVAVEWPALLVSSRVDQLELGAGNPLNQPPWRAELRQLPAVTYRVAPRALAGMLFALGGIMILGGVALCFPTLRRQRAAGKHGSVVLAPLEQALALLESQPDATIDAGPKRQALELVAAELGRRGEHDLELSARRLAWSADDPAYEDTSALARDVRLAAESTGSVR
jgi:hypothetical protein